MTGGNSIRNIMITAAAFAVLANSAAAQDTAPTQTAQALDAAALLAGTAGEWTGELQYRDYQTNTWLGLPVTVAIRAQPDGVTVVRTATYDDGPVTGLVWITTSSIVDRTTSVQSWSILRKGRAMDAGTAQLSIPTPAADATHWTIVATSRQQDGNAIAAVRETTVRDGATMTTLKEVNPDGDGSDQWLPRNRTVLTARPE